MSLQARLLAFAQAVGADIKALTSAIAAKVNATNPTTSGTLTHAGDFVLKSAANAYSPTAAGFNFHYNPTSGFATLGPYSNGGVTQLFLANSPSPGVTKNQVQIDINGNVAVIGGGVLGYGSGTGGTVVQATNRTTAVTLNKPTGEITLVSAAGTATVQSFTVNNSLVTATDHPRVIQKSGADLYEIYVTNVSAGSFRVSFRTTGGTTTEQPVFMFDIAKGASS